MLEDYTAASGTFVPIWRLEIQTPCADNHNPHRWWNNGRGMPNKIDKISLLLGG